MKTLLTIFFLFTFTAIHAQDTPAPVQKKFEMKTYYLVFLKKGPHRDQDSTTMANIQEGHMAHLNKMHDLGKMCIAGPLMDDGDIRGICVYVTETIEEATRLVNEDPAIKSGRLVAEIHPWYAAKGSKLL